MLEELLEAQGEIVLEEEVMDVNEKRDESEEKEKAVEEESLEGDEDMKQVQVVFEETFNSIHPVPSTLVDSEAKEEICPSGPSIVKKMMDELDELIYELGQDWFDDDLSLTTKSKAGQQNQKAIEPSKPDTKVPMVVPHNVAEVTRLVHLASQQMWMSCQLGRGPRVLTDALKPDIPLGIYSQGDNMDTRSRRSYRMVSDP